MSMRNEQPGKDCFELVHQVFLPRLLAIINESVINTR